jgi:DUF1009 family protein
MAGMRRKKKTIGLISGLGELPRTIALEARQKGYAIAAVNLEGLSDGSVAEHAEASEWFNAGKAGAIIRFLRKHGAAEAVMAGKVPKSLLLRGGIRPDLKGAKMLFKLRDRSDDAILRLISEELEGEGIRLLDMRDFCEGLMTPEGVLTRKRPGRAGWRDIEYGFHMAREIGRLGIGQTVVVKDRSVVSVEAAEGTDEAIRRAGDLTGGGATVVKASRPGQDMRFDVPVVGLATLEVMVSAGVVALAVEAGRSIFLQRDEFIRRADRAGIAVVGHAA